jgi:hypothetical protein
VDVKNSIDFFSEGSYVLVVPIRSGLFNPNIVINRVWNGGDRRVMESPTTNNGGSSHGVNLLTWL